jgi:hypothetical protein
VGLIACSMSLGSMSLSNLTAKPSSNCLTISDTFCALFARSSHGAGQERAGCLTTRPAASFAPRTKRWTSSAACPEPKGYQSAQRNYERYLALAHTKAQTGNLMGARITTSTPNIISDRWPRIPE